MLNGSLHLQPWHKSPHSLSSVLRRRGWRGFLMDLLVHAKSIKIRIITPTLCSYLLVKLRFSKPPHFESSSEIIQPFTPSLATTSICEETRLVICCVDLNIYPTYSLPRYNFERYALKEEFLWDASLRSCPLNLTHRGVRSSIRASNTYVILETVQ